MGVPIKSVNLKNSGNEIINPATQDTLALIKDTDGIKKITDDVNVSEKPNGGAAYCPDAYDSSALEASAVIKASAGALYRISGYNSSVLAQYIQIFNSATVPADGTAPLIVFSANAASPFFFDTGRFGKRFSVGISVSNSSTLSTKTIGSADCWFNALYK